MERDPDELLGTEQIKVNVSGRIHRRLRLLAAARGTQVGHLIRAGISMILEKHKEQIAELERRPTSGPTALELLANPGAYELVAWHRCSSEEPAWSRGAEHGQPRFPLRCGLCHSTAPESEYRIEIRKRS